MNFYLVEQNKPTKNGRKVYLDAVNYFRGDAVKDAILNQNMTELMNYKLTPNTFNGAEGYNNKFNDIINTLQQQGHSLSPPILKSVYLANIQDRTYEHIRDQASTDVETTLSGVQSAILRKYLSVIGERRRGAPPYTNKRFVNNMNSNQRVQFDPNDTVYEFEEDAREQEYVNSTSAASIV